MSKIKKADILDKVKLTLEDLFKGELTLMDKNWTLNQDNEVDGYLLFNNIKFPFVVITQPTQPKVSRFANSFSKEKNILFILDYADSVIIDWFKRENLFFIDTAGNCYVNLPDFKIAIEGRKNIFGKLPDSKVAFQEAGLKLIYQLLIDPKLTKETYSTIASKTRTSLANVYGIFEELRREGFATGLLPPNKDKTLKGSLSNVELLITKWAIGYSEVLRPKIHRGYFRSLTPDLEAHIISDNSNKIYFGGQFGAHYLNNETTARKPVLFSNIRLGEMIKKYKIVPIAVPQNYHRERIEVLEIFWNTEEFNRKQSDKKVKNIVDPILIYADLMMSDDFRSRDAAKNILENEIRDKFIRYKLQW